MSCESLPTHNGRVSWDRAIKKARDDSKKYGTRIRIVGFRNHKGKWCYCAQCIPDKASQR